MSFIGKGQDGQVPVASGNSIVWEDQAVSSGTTSPLDDAFSVLDNTSSVSDINAALVAKDIVYLRPGTYSPAIQDQIVIPDGKQLIGLSAAAKNDASNLGRTGQVYFQWPAGTKTNDGVSMGFRSAIKNISLDWLLGTQNGSLYGINGAPVAANINDWVTIERVTIHGWDSSGGFCVTLREGIFRESQIRLVQAGGLLLQAKSGNTQLAWTLIENIHMEGVNGPASIEIVADPNVRRTKIIGCWLACAFAGIVKGDTTQNEDFHVINNYFRGGSQLVNCLEGFGGCGLNCKIEGNTIDTYIGAGPSGKWANLTAANGTDKAVIRNNIAINCTDTTGVIPASWLASGNTVAT